MGRIGLGEDAVIAVGQTAVAALAWRYVGALRVTVIAKASFAFARDAEMMRTGAQPIVRNDVHHGKSPARSIQLATDLVPYLHRGEVFVTGHAYAPPGTTPEAMSVRLGVFDDARPLVDKTLHLRRRGGFQKVPLVFENAYGGFGWIENPVGLGAPGSKGEPTIFDPANEQRRAGFGPIGWVWAERARLLGHTPRRALEGPLIEIPDGFDWTYFQAAPPDQQLDFLRGDEWIVMDGLHPALPRARTRLPGARGAARVYGLSPFGVAEGQPLALHADTLRIDSDEQRFTLTFRGVFPVASEGALAAVRVVAGVELPGAPVAFDDAAMVALRREPRADAPVTPVTSGATGQETIMLDVSDFSGTMMLETMMVEEHVEEPAAPALPFRDGAASGPKPRAPALPFQGEISPFAQASRRPAAPRHDLFGGTLMPDDEAPPARKSVLPFGEMREEPAPVPEPAPIPSPPPPPAKPVAPAPSGSPWALPPPATAAPPAGAVAKAPVPPAIPMASPMLKKGLYGRFGGKR